jgi:AraC family transcriptional regulator
MLSLRPEGELHAKQVGPEGARALSLLVSPHGEEMLSFHTLNLQQGQTVHGTAQGTALKLLRELRQCRSSTSLFLLAMTLELVSHFEEPRADNRGVSRKQWLGEVKQLLNDNFLQTLPLAKLASQANVHPIHLARTFRSTYGCTIGDYIRGLRIESACRDLTESELAITQVALRAGFADHGHFCRVFKQQLGMSPTVFRGNYRSLVAQHAPVSKSRNLSG